MQRVGRPGLVRRYRKQILLAAVIPVVGLLIFLMIRPEAEQPQQPAGGQQTTPFATVRYDGVSFQPEYIRISAGTSVTFLNASPYERPLYIASDPHPTHEDYAGLDARAILGRTPQPGDSQSFAFDRRGVWGYHDHNSPSATGTVEVY